ncbi:T-cell receptor beta chain ANA 11 [Salpingoeca rosetta]|uniref:T-cell receptor beta chain ANA 11 n=1 Tax=Salpingoeca rosetta (strain ATCC 50818 / BSB-021) TaxID=946362 RepID=F2U897_SALR5|nr:T-cell receptor beta chain ANA 11 [Salpingoeca rosetta]EGD72605.1 T-cell receptor beta chain ANA 11 [Salpingoeca rosetta]|eukprot:XP_004994428.1 T-cell receptor beta chain ANA 11 [Salpingoeca rosetta]
MAGGGGASARKELVRAVGLCMLWYLGSMMNSIFSKSAMKVFPRPITVTMAQLLMVNICLPFFLPSKMPRLSRKDWTSWVIPLTVLKIVVSLSSQISILKVPVAYAHTVKGMMPIFTVFLSKVFLNQHHPLLAYISLIPIISGVVIASVTELQFDLLGLISALVATFTFAIQNIFSKKVMKKGVHHISILLLVSQSAFVALLPYWLWNEGTDILFGDTFTSLGDQAFVVLYEMALCGLCSAIQTIAAFTFLSYVTPVTYSVANVAKRIVIIVASMLFFQNPATPANIAGIAISICGIALYNKSKLDERRRTQMQQQLAMDEAKWGGGGGGGGVMNGYNGAHHQQQQQPSFFANQHYTSGGKRKPFGPLHVV